MLFRSWIRPLVIFQLDSKHWKNSKLVTRISKQTTFVRRSFVRVRIYLRLIRILVNFWSVLDGLSYIIELNLYVKRTLLKLLLLSTAYGITVMSMHLPLPLFLSLQNPMRFFDCTLFLLLELPSIVCLCFPLHKLNIAYIKRKTD